MLYITSNEFATAPGIISLLDSFHIPYQQHELKVGDVFVGQITSAGEYIGVAVERKEITDYIGSKQTGHLDEQLSSMSSTFPLSFVFVIGSPSMAYLDGKVSRNSLLSSFVGTALKRSPEGVQGVVSMFNVETDIDYVIMLKYLDEKLEKGDLIRVPQMQRRASKPDEMQEFVVAGLPKVGAGLAQKLLEHFGSVRRVYTATKDELLEVEGIGERKASEIVLLLDLKYQKHEDSMIPEAPPTV